MLFGFGISFGPTRFDPHKKVPKGALMFLSGQLAVQVRGSKTSESPGRDFGWEVAPQLFRKPQVAISPEISDNVVYVGILPAILEHLLTKYVASHELLHPELLKHGILVRGIS